MFSIKTAFGRAASGSFGPGTLWLLFFAIIILDDSQREELQRRDQRKQPFGPRTF